MEIHFQKTIIFSMKILFANKTRDISSSEELLKKFFRKKNVLVNHKISEFIELFSNISKYWSSDKCKIRNIFLEYEMGFLIAWLKKKNLIDLLKVNFKDYEILDYPKLNKNNIFFLARPRGIALHWLAGNVPVLGVISLFQSLITKNKSVIKVPLNLQNILPKILDDLKGNKFFSKKNRNLLEDILSSIIVLYVEKNNTHFQELLSQNADIRVGWGGLEGISAFLKLPKKLTCRDIVFGPKVSLALVKKEKLKSKTDLMNVSKLICNDIIPFNQMGCNSPHNLIIEKGSKFTLADVAKAIDGELEKRKINLKFTNDPLINFNILSKKFLFQTEKKKKVILGKDGNWNIYINSNPKVEIQEPLFRRNLFLSEFKKIEDIGKILPNNTQSIGLMCNKNHKSYLISYLSNFNVDRFPDLGKMSLYQNPWDGYLPLHDMVRWVSSS